MAKKRSWFKVVQKAFDLFLHRDEIAYFLGAKGITLTRENMNYLWNENKAYLDGKFNAEEKAQIFRNSIGKKGYDCSGYYCACTGEDDYSTGLYNKRAKETSLVDGVAGQGLYTTWGGTGYGRHIGLDIGYGYFMDCAYFSTDANIARNRHSIRFGKISDVAWEHSFQSKNINYSGSIATDPNAVK